MNGWLNIYKPKHISSAKAVALIKKNFPTSKIGHTGTLDLEAEGVLPIAIGEATKLVSVLMEAKKQYSFTIKFGAKTDTADAAGKVIEVTDTIPTEHDAHQVCDKFIGQIQQVPPAYSALKINGIRAYKLARQGQKIKLPKRDLHIYSLKCIHYSKIHGTATYLCECSKGTYIRTLAEDISLSLQSLGFVIELVRSAVGMFNVRTAIDIAYDVVSDRAFDSLKNRAMLLARCLKIEAVLEDIPVLDATDNEAKAIRYGQKSYFNAKDYNLVWIRNNNCIVAIGCLQSKSFKSSRVFTYS